MREKQAKVGIKEKFWSRGSVPTFMIPYLASFKDANDPRLQNFSLIPTFACFSLKHDYPRVIPPIVFLSGHNVIASLPSNSSVGTINHDD